MIYNCNCFVFVSVVELIFHELDLKFNLGTLLLNLNKLIQITRHDKLKGSVSLPASKSISNRAIVINALAGKQCNLLGLSDARDTELMANLIHSQHKALDPQDAGTTMRFLTAYFAATNQEKILLGSTRMRERPIAILVDALRTIGANINYLEKEGYPPIHILGMPKQLSKKISVRGDVSSQYISALMMIAPFLPQGLEITVEGKPGSLPYIQMTASMMKSFGADIVLRGSEIFISPSKYNAPTSYRIEPDWSAASYWFAFAALAEESEIILNHLDVNSLQGDKVIVDMMDQLGVSCKHAKGGIQLEKRDSLKNFTYDFSDCPDLAQTVAVVCAAKGISARFSGLKSLRIKETDRCKALQIELAKIGVEFTETVKDVWSLNSAGKINTKNIVINTYDDHRMAMAFAPLACIMDIEIENPEVVNKSYPQFWNEMLKVGFKINEV